MVLVFYVGPIALLLSMFLVIYARRKYQLNKDIQMLGRVAKLERSLSLKANKGINS